MMGPPMGGVNTHTNTTTTVKIVEKGQDFNPGIYIGRSEPTSGHCPNCDKVVISNVAKETTSTQWIACCALSVLFPLTCWVPFCVSDCYRFKHTCAQCGFMLGNSQ